MKKPKKRSVTILAEDGKFPDKETIKEIRTHQHCAIMKGKYIAGSDPYEEASIVVENTDKDKETIRKIKEELKKPGLKAQVDTAKIEDYNNLTKEKLDDLKPRVGAVRHLYDFEPEKNPKYYVPSIEEFHPGFEYEVSNYIVAGTLKVRPKEAWFKEVFNTSSVYKFDFIEHVLKSGDEKIVRVKYLDKDDIKYLGWKMRAEAVSGGNPNNPTLIFKMDTYELRYTISENGIPCISIKDTYVDYQHFSGFIKNKSNLKTLMQWTNIIRQQ